MKYSAALLTVLAIGVIQGGKSLPTILDDKNHSLQDDINDFAALIPEDKLRYILMTYADQDKEFQDFIGHIFDPETKQMIYNVEAVEEVQEIIKYLHETGTNIHEFLDKLHEFLRMGPYKPVLKTNEVARIRGGLKGFFEDLWDAIPTDKLKKMYREKMRTSTPFKNFMKFLRSKAVVDKVSQIEEVQHFLVYLESKNINVEEAFEMLNSFFGINSRESYSVKNSQLQDDLDEFRDLLPINKIKRLILQYLTTDLEFREFMQFIISEKNQEFVRKIERVIEVREIIKYLHDAGTDIYQILNEVHELMEMEQYKPTLKNVDSHITGGLKGFFKDVFALVPLEKMKELYEQKMQTSEEFKKLVEFLKARAQAVADQISAMEEAKEFENYLKSKDVDFQKVLDLLSSYFGIQFGPHASAQYYTLQDDFNEFRDLIPVNKIKRIFLQYLSSDEEFEEFVAYLISPQSKQMVLNIEAVDEVREVIKYVHDAGIDIYEMLNKIHSYLEMENYKPSLKSVDLRITGGLKGFFEDVIKEIPIEKLKELYEQKMKNSPELKKCVNFIKSKAKEIYKKVLKIEQVQKMVEYLKSRNVDVKEVIDTISSYFGVDLGLKCTSYSHLQKDFDDFARLVPMQKIKSIAFQYMLKDGEFQSFYRYLSSSKTKKMVVNVEAVREVQAIIKYLHDAGTTVQEALNKVHSYLGLKMYKPVLRSENKNIRGGLKGFFEDVWDVVPADKFEALYKEKIKSSTEFKNMTKFVVSNAQHVVDKVSQIEQVRNMVSYLKARKVDTEKVADFLSSFFGVTFNENWNHLELFYKMDKLFNILWEGMISDF